MKPIKDLINIEAPGMALINQWIGEAVNNVEVLPPSEENENVLYELQITTGSSMGAIAYETGGVLIDGGWLRLLGSGHKKLPRTLIEHDHRSNGFIVFADDVVGGFFAVNGGELGDDLGMVYYLAPDDIDWEPLEISYSSFFEWSLSENLAEFYLDFRWSTWREDLAKLAPDKCFGFYPFLWTEQADIETANRNPVPVREAWNLKIDMQEQL